MPKNLSGNEVATDWKDRVAYDEGKYMVAFARRGSPLAAVNVAITGKAS